MTLFEPSPVLIAFIFVQRFVFFEVLAVLALLRLAVGRGLARLPAILTLGICVAAIFVTFAPALNLQTSALYTQLAQFLAMGGGTTMTVIASLIFAISLFIAERRWRWIDILHLIGLAAFLGLWVYTRI